ncbi:MAG: PaaI family thioesterase [Streptosporangiaceae bacterium]|nr:PaaI family thioesterase [Streptosporangiaceae bacterium]MBV9853403.1 PaaI family thioesterase [Streptosporangiaceae bacterium]
MERAEQEHRRGWFRERWAHGVPFSKHCGIEVRRWDAEAIELLLPYAEEVSAHAGIYHGGVVSALLDTTASGAVMADHDFAKGSRLTTISLLVQFLSVVPGEDLLAAGRCTRRSRTVHFAEAQARGAARFEPAASSSRTKRTSQRSALCGGESTEWEHSDPDTLRVTR